jgi:hypothetical protein
MHPTLWCAFPIQPSVTDKTWIGHIYSNHLQQTAEPILELLPAK